MSIVNDTHLAYLLSLGFDIDLCKQALKQNSSLETATDWILNPSHPPTLNLGLDLSQPHSSSGPLSSSSSLSQNALLKERQDREIKLQQKNKFEKIQNELKKDKQLEKEARQRALLDIKEDQEKRKLKGLSTSHQQQQQQQQQVLSERQKIQNKIKREKQLDREQRQRILQNIKNDKIDKKYKPTMATSCAPNKSTTATSSSSDISEAFIQFKLSNGSSLRQKFIATTKVDEIFQFVLKKELELYQHLAVDKISLVCGFPRRTFTVDDGNLDMKEAGFLPNVSLNVVVSKEAPPVEIEEDQLEEEEEQMDDNDEEDLNEMDLDEEPMPLDILDRQMPELNRRQHTARGPVTSGGHRLGDTPTTVQEDTTTHVTEDAVMEDVERRTHILSALEQRNQPMPTISMTPTNNPRIGKKRNVKTLKDICSIHVAGFLSQHTVTANKHLKKLVYTSSDVAEFLLSYLIKSGQLNVSTLRKLADHCYLQNIVLDSYSYCTDSLIEDVCKSNSSISITKLSLRGCDVITDGAIRALEGLKNLMYLDLTNCKVTDKGLKSIEKLHHLSWLNLSKTKISNVGLDSLVSNANFKNELQVLLLDGCTRIHANGILVPIVDAFINLIQLSYAYTTYKQQQPEKEMKLTNKHVKLEQLDVNHTFVHDQELVHVISRFKNLVELKLGGCDDVTTKSLSFLPIELKRLEYIQFPNREHELDGVLSRYKDLPLKQLDLTGFLNVTDEGAQSISCMKDLRSLSLIGTKVTDEGISYLKDLTELETLSLDRTLLTDTGLEKLKGLSKLETLSLCRTGISNEGLCLLGDFEQTSFTRNLRTLNLSQCTLVTDKGVCGISGMFNLTNLNLDHTGVSKSCLKYLKDLEHLNPVRLQGIEKEEDDTMDME